MKQISKFWLLLYALISLVIFLILGVKGMGDPLSLTHLLVPGGLVESVPTLFWALAAVLSLVVAWGLRRRKQFYIYWIFYAGLCMFLAGEETGWGRESLLGWQALAGPGSEDLALHNWFLDFVQAGVEMLERNDLLTITLLVLGSGVTIACGSALMYILKKRGQTIVALWSEIYNRLPRTFFVLGLFLIILGNFFDLLGEIGQPYFRGQWVLEESLEAVGSLAFLFAVTSKIHIQYQRNKEIQ